MSYVQSFDSLAEDAKSAILKAMEIKSGFFIAFPNPGQSAQATHSTADPKSMLDQLSPAAVIKLADEFSHTLAIRKEYWSDRADSLRDDAERDIRSSLFVNCPVKFKDLRAGGIFKGPNGQPVEIPTIWFPLYGEQHLAVTNIFKDDDHLFVGAEFSSSDSEKKILVALPLTHLRLTEILRLADFIHII